MTLTKMIGLGVAGNFAGHLEQAGEASDFINIQVKETTEPKAIFPFYVPNLGNSFLNTFPITHDKICYPNSGDNLQIEPEIALICDIIYEDSQVKALIPCEFAAFNDCSIRRPGARKISEKKNWGPASKGISRTRIALKSFVPGCELDYYHIASFLRRDGQCHAYGMDSPAIEYSYFHENLLNWIVDKMNNQQDEGPAEAIPPLLQAAGYPQQAIIGIGATRYKSFGAQTFLLPGDESIVVVYDTRLHSAESVQQMAETGEFKGARLSVVRQQVVAS